MARKNRRKRNRAAARAAKARTRETQNRELVLLHTRIEGRERTYVAERIGELTSSRLEQLKAETAAMPWNYRVSRIAAKTGRPFSEIAELL
jgi:hypothetical protein